MLACAPLPALCWLEAWLIAGEPSYYFAPLLIASQVIAFDQASSPVNHDAPSRLAATASRPISLRLPTRLHHRQPLPHQIRGVGLAGGFHSFDGSLVHGYAIVAHRIAAFGVDQRHKLSVKSN